jgi:hypothetical protein
MLAHENARSSDGAGKGDARKAGISELGEGEVEQDGNVEERLAAYFESVLEIAGKTALPEFLPSLSAALASATALDELVLNLRTQQVSSEPHCAYHSELGLLLSFAIRGPLCSFEPQDDFLLSSSVHACPRPLNIFTCQYTLALPRPPPSWNNRMR